MFNMNMIDSIEFAISCANKEITILPESVLTLSGYSSPKVRIFLNNLLYKIEASYLEIGLWKGSTFISALFGNRFKYALGIDNNSEFGNVKEERNKNIQTYLNTKHITLLDQNCFTIDLSSFENKYNIYFYDGNHTYESQKKAFTYYNPILEDRFIAIVDDYNRIEVKQGTQDAFRELKYTIEYEHIELTNMEGDPESFWNGLYIGIIKK